MNSKYGGRGLAAAALAAILLGGATIAGAQMGPRMAERGHPMMTERGAAAAEPGGTWDMGYGMGMAHHGWGMMGPGAGMMHHGWGMMEPGAGMMMGRGMGMMGPLMLRDLSPEQRTQMRTLLREMRRAQLETILETMDAREALLEALMAERPDPKVVRELHDRLSGLYGDMMQSRIETRNRIHDLLTDEQRERLRELRGRMGPALED